jgi:hypothetical protein
MRLPDVKAADAGGGVHEEVVTGHRSGHVHLSEMPAAAFVTPPEVQVHVVELAAEVAPPGHAGHVSVVALEPCVYELAVHAHCVLPVAFTEAELAGHGRQVAAPDPNMKVLSGHGAHEARSGEPVEFTAEPGGHGTHEDTPVRFWYRPAGHGVHVAAAAELAPSGPTRPLAQALPRQAVRPVASA